MQAAEQLRKLLTDPKWRINNLYWITDKTGHLVRFRMNWAQEELHDTAHTRNNILKVRQLGISTYMAIRMLDACLFTPNYHAGIVDRTLPDAKAKLGKIKFAFNHLDHLPENPTPQDRALAEVGATIKRLAAGTTINKSLWSFTTARRYSSAPPCEAAPCSCCTSPSSAP